MADLLQAGLLWLSDIQQAHQARTVYYERTGAGVCQLLATPGPRPRPREPLALEGGSATAWTGTIWTFPAASLVLGGAPVLPARGDRIRDEVDGTTWTYEVLAEPGEEPYYWADTACKVLRVRTKLLSREGADER